MIKFKFLTFFFQNKMWKNYNDLWHENKLNNYIRGKRDRERDREIER